MEQKVTQKVTQIVEPKNWIKLLLSEDQHKIIQNGWMDIANQCWIKLLPENNLMSVDFKDINGNVMNEQNEVQYVWIPPFSGEHNHECMFYLTIEALFSRIKSRLLFYKKNKISVRDRISVYMTHDYYYKASVTLLFCKDPDEEDFAINCLSDA